MNKALIVAVLVIGLAGCATPNDVRKSAPELQLTSTKTPKQVASCIADKWEDAKLLVRSRETERGYALTVMINDVLCYLADVVGSADKTSTKYYVNCFSYDLASSAVKSCQN